jgi:tRNA-Thr(GGU) m(6)t(6)A37 methyltransferase TsaA
MSGIVLRPVGFVRNEMRKAVPRGEYENVVSDVIVEEEFSAGLDDIEEHSHAVIIFWLDRISEDERKLLKVRPKGDPSLPIVGVFATRSPARPNPIGIETVEIVSRDGDLLRVRGLDALDGSPVLDIKPYTKLHDRADEVRGPSWMGRAHRGH